MTDFVGIYSALEKASAAKEFEGAGKQAKDSFSVFAFDAVGNLRISHLSLLEFGVDRQLVTPPPARRPKQSQSVRDLDTPTS